MNDFVAFHTSYRVATVGGMVSLKIYSLIEKPKISTYFKTPKWQTGGSSTLFFVQFTLYFKIQ